MERTRANRVTTSFVCGTCVFRKCGIMGNDLKAYCDVTKDTVNKSQPFCYRFLSNRLLDNWVDIQSSVLNQTDKRLAFH